MSEIMPRLKAETRSEHTATEETDLARSMLLSTMTRSEYEAQLVSYLTVLTALERAAGASLRVSQVLGTTSKAARIRADLSALEKVCHRPISASPTTAAQEFAERILAADEPQVLGIAYVMEGSSLGAAVLYPRLKKALGLEDHALTYYRGEGSAMLGSWRAFGTRMNEHLTDAREQDRAVAAACQAFVAIRRIFEAIRPSEVEVPRPAAPRTLTDHA